jgi:hypothetical protein
MFIPDAVPAKLQIRIFLNPGSGIRSRFFPDPKPILFERFFVNLTKFFLDQLK